MNSNGTVDLLLVEDNPQDLELMLRALREAGAASRIHVVRDGAEALEFIFGSGRPDLRAYISGPRVIVLDLKLPKVDGLEVLRRLKRDPRTTTIPVVVLTSSSESRDLAASLELGVNSYVVKSVDSERFGGAVRDIGRYWLQLNRPPGAWA